MTTADRVDSLLDSRWEAATVVTDGYIGKHRLVGFRATLSVRRFFYLAKHRR